MRLRYSDIGKFQVTGWLLLCIFRGVRLLQVRKMEITAIGSSSSIRTPGLQTRAILPDRTCGAGNPALESRGPFKVSGASQCCDIVLFYAQIDLPE